MEGWKVLVGGVEWVDIVKSLDCAWLNDGDVMGWDGDSYSGNDNDNDNDGNGVGYKLVVSGTSESLDTYLDSHKRGMREIIFRVYGRELRGVVNAEKLRTRKDEEVYML